MPDIADGETVLVQGSAKDPYELKNTGGVYSCTCPAWRVQSTAIEKRTCKHLRQYRGEEAEIERLGSVPERAVRVRTAPEPNGSRTEGSADDTVTPGFLLAHSWSNDIDLKGWWMSEKLDGVRAYWDGTRFISRQGNVYMAPDWFVEGLPPDIHLDGELWLARKAFQRAVSIVRRQDKNKDWQEITYVVFDAPKAPGVFEERVQFVEKLMEQLRPKYARPHEHAQCEGLDHLTSELKRVEEAGGEGLMLRKPGSKYEVGRSFTLLKVKTFHDAEAKVVGHAAGTGKHKGRLGSLTVQLANGATFSVGTGFSDAERENPPPIGSIITFRYQELSDGGIPRFPSFVRLRDDVDQLPDNLEKKVVGTKNAGGTPALHSPETNARGTPALHSPIPERRHLAGIPNSGGTSRALVYRNGNVNATWSIQLVGNRVHTEFKRNNDLESADKTFSDEKKAADYFDRQLAQKLRAGFCDAD